MKSKLIFLNLLIDSLWSDDGFLSRVFDVSSPETLRLSRVNEYLGRFFGSDGDVIIVPGPSDERYVEMQELHFDLSNPTFISVPIPLNNIKEFVSTIKNSGPDVRSVLFSGTSDLELLLAKELGLVDVMAVPDLKLVKELNRKDYLIGLAKDLNIAMPASEVISGAQMSETNDLFKSLVSSGGSGVYTYTDAMKVKAWALRKNMSADWDNSRWIKQELIDRKLDLNCFGHTESVGFNFATIKYDQNRLSLRHDINSPIDPAFEKTLRNTFEATRLHLKNRGYFGYFGFDSIVSKNGTLYPIVDLNVRMNKSHVLHQISKCIKFPEANISFFRLRFINNRWLNFRDFWAFLDRESDSVFKKSEGAEIIPVDWSYWNLGKSECLMAVSSTTPESADAWEVYLNRFIESQRGQNV